MAKAALWRVRVIERVDPRLGYIRPVVYAGPAGAGEPGAEDESPVVLRFVTLASCASRARGAGRDAWVDLHGHHLGNGRRRGLLLEAVEEAPDSTMDALVNLHGKVHLARGLDWRTLCGVRVIETSGEIPVVKIRAGWRRVGVDEAFGWEREPAARCLNCRQALGWTARIQGAA